MENNRTITTTKQPIIIKLQPLAITITQQHQLQQAPTLNMPLGITLKLLFSILKLEDLLV